MKLELPGSLPRWQFLAFRNIERRFNEPQSAPFKLLEVAAPADLPAAADWRGAIVFVKSIDRLAVSNGTNWLRTDTGATL